MPHKAGADFFKAKREWSKRKDSILEFYLRPYLRKVSTLGRPILLVDGFAGKGRFDDGMPGSPVILCEYALEARERGTKVRVLCIESGRELFEALEENLKPYGFAEPIHGRFSGYLPEIAGGTTRTTTFVYIDPFAPEGLEWDALDKLFSCCDLSSSSLEVLWNFNAPAFVRRGRAALSMTVPVPDPELEDPEEMEPWFEGSASVERLNRIVGGVWWREILESTDDFCDCVVAIAKGVFSKLSKRFPEVCSVAIKKEDSHRRPKYYMVFASRSPDALRLMNDAMFRAKNNSQITMDLFASVELPELIGALTERWIKRGDLRAAVIRRQFCKFEDKDIRACIEELLKGGNLESKTGKIRINDDTPVRRSR